MCGNGRERKALPRYNRVVHARSVVATAQWRAVQLGRLSQELLFIYPDVLHVHAIKKVVDRGELRKRQRIFTNKVLSAIAC